MARLLSFKAGTGETQVVECNDLQDYYNALECDCFDIASRKIGNAGRWFDVFCDDCGLFVDNPIISMINMTTMKPELVGNLIFAHHDSAGETTGLSDDDIKYIKENIISVVEMSIDGINEFPVVLCR